MAFLAFDDIGGSGEPFVLVHGYTGSSDDFRPVVEPLTAHSRVTLVDQLGHGASPRMPRYDLDALTVSLVAFLEDRCDEPAHILGHSMGGRTVLPIAIDRPDLVRSLILMDTWADEADRADDADFFEAAMALPQDEALAALDDHWSEPGPEERLIIERWGAEWATAHWGYNADHVDPVARYELGRQILVPSPGVLDRAGTIDCPTTVICGQHDAAFRSASDRMAATIPDAALEIIEGAYHSPQLTHPEQWVDILSRHLQRSM